MGKTTSIGNVLAWPFLLPGNIACEALGLGEHQNLVRRMTSLKPRGDRFRQVIHLLGSGGLKGASDKGG